MCALPSARPNALARRCQQTSNVTDAWSLLSADCSPYQAAAAAHLPASCMHCYRFSTARLRVP